MSDGAKTEQYYNGAVNDYGIAHGIGERKYANGSVYVGNFVNGKKCGKGKMAFSGEEEYEGEWEDDERLGKGKYTWPNGDTYVGDWRNGKSHGKGRMKYANGNEYEGEWEDDEIHGKGTYTWPNGDTYVGDWRNDKSHGKGTMKYASGNEHEGEWEDDKRHGEFTVKLTNGEVFKWVYFQGDLKSSKRCVSDNAPIHRLLSSPRSCAEDTYDVIVFNQHDKECPLCFEKFHPDDDAKKPVIGSCLCSYTVCHKCVLGTAKSKMNGGGVVPARVDCMGCRAKDAFCPAVPQYNWTLIDFLKRSIPVLRKTDHCG